MAGGGARGAGHGLGSSCEDNVAFAENDVLSAVYNRLESTAAETVDGEGGGMHWHARAQTNVAGAEEESQKC